MRLSVNYKQQGTHMLTLIKAVEATDGDVCEMGAGFSSTPLLHWVTLGRKLVTYETDPDWVNFAIKFGSYNHRIRLTKNFSDVDFNRKWSVVFIDGIVTLIFYLDRFPNKYCKPVMQIKIHWLCSQQVVAA